MFLDVEDVEDEDGKESNLTNNYTITITTSETLTLSIMQNILLWKFNLNFRAKFDLSAAGHQN